MTDRGSGPSAPYFVVTVDTEADDAWERPDTVDVTNIRQLERFQDLCDRHGVVPTYLLTYECATRDESATILKSLADNRQCEIGHHLHVWTTPPFQNEGPSGVDSAWIHGFQFELPDSLFEEKAECLRQAIEDTFGRSPTSHRAGRWGVDQRTVDWLSASGFVVETSMRYALRLREPETKGKLLSGNGRVAASGNYELRHNPYIWGPNDGPPDGGRVVEIPATVDAPNGLLPSLYLRFLRLKWPGETFFFKVFRKLAGAHMLCPDPRLPSGTLPAIMRRAMGRGVTVINLALHSSELELNCSPFTRNEHDQSCVWQHLDEAFAFARQCRMITGGISDVAGRVLPERSL